MFVQHLSKCGGKRILTSIEICDQGLCNVRHSSESQVSGYMINTFHIWRS